MASLRICLVDSAAIRRHPAASPSRQPLPLLSPNDGQSPKPARRTIPAPSGATYGNAAAPPPIASPGGREHRLRASAIPPAAGPAGPAVTLTLRFPIMPKESPWPDPPGYRATLAAMKQRQPWKALTPPPNSNVATIMVATNDSNPLPYRWLNRGDGR